MCAPGAPLVSRAARSIRALYFARKAVAETCRVSDAQADSLIKPVLALQLWAADGAVCWVLHLADCLLYVGDLVDPLFFSGLLLFNSKLFYRFSRNSGFFFAVKFCACIGFLILIRGGTPRYRYDYLTKLG